MPRYGSETSFERDKRKNKGKPQGPRPPYGGNPFMTPVKKAFDSNFKKKKA